MTLGRPRVHLFNPLERTQNHHLDDQRHFLWWVAYQSLSLESRNVSKVHLELKWSSLTYYFYHLWACLNFVCIFCGPCQQNKMKERNRLSPKHENSQLFRIACVLAIFQLCWDKKRRSVNLMTYPPFSWSVYKLMHECTQAQGWILVKPSTFLATVCRMSPGTRKSGSRLEFLSRCGLIGISGSSSWTEHALAIVSDVHRSQVQLKRPKVASATVTSSNPSVVYWPLQSSNTYNLYSRVDCHTTWSSAPEMIYEKHFLTSCAFSARSSLLQSRRKVAIAIACYSLIDIVFIIS